MPKVAPKREYAPQQSIWVQLGYNEPFMIVTNA
jgi:hypothetical protein